MRDDDRYRRSRRLSRECHSVKPNFADRERDQRNQRPGHDRPSPRRPTPARAGPPGSPKAESDHTDLSAAAAFRDVSLCWLYIGCTYAEEGWRFSGRFPLTD